MNEQIKMRDVSNRTKNTIVRHVEKLISKYGFTTARLVIRRYFLDKQAEETHKKTIKKAEDELKELRKKQR